MFWSKAYSPKAGKDIILLFPGTRFQCVTEGTSINIVIRNVQMNAVRTNKLKYCPDEENFYRG